MAAQLSTPTKMSQPLRAWMCSPGSAAITSHAFEIPTPSFAMTRGGATSRSRRRPASCPPVDDEPPVPAAVDRAQRRRGRGTERTDQVPEEDVLPSAYDRIADDVAGAHVLEVIHQIACVRKFAYHLAGVVDPEIVVHRQADRLPAREEVVGRVAITNHHGLRWQVFADTVDHAVVLSPKRDVAPARGARVEADVDGERGEGALEGGDVPSRERDCWSRAWG